MHFLATLHAIWFTHADLKKIFESNTEYEKVYQKILSENTVEYPWISPERKEKILKNIKNINVWNIQHIIHEKNIELITLHDSRYPESLRTIKQAPYLLYIRWTLRNDMRLLGIVWSRKSTSYGKKVLENIIPKLTAKWFGVVSGWAYGIDAISHEVTLEHGGYTISVFWCSVDIYYPVQNTRLFDRILEQGGALVSIFPLGTQAEPYMFPIRNEVVAALSVGIIIPEAGIKSGTLITAALALEHGRDVFAIPWDITRETSMWTNTLIARGEAKCIQQAEDILEEYFPSVPTEKLSLFESPEFESEEQKIIYSALLDGYTTTDELWQNTDLEFDTIVMNLTLMELSWYIRLNTHGKYEII